MIKTKKIAILASVGVLIAGFGIGTPEINAGEAFSNCILQSPIADPLLVLSVGSHNKFFTTILEKEVFLCGGGISGLAVDTSTIIRDVVNKNNVLKNRTVTEVICFKDPLQSPVPNCSKRLIPLDIVSGITLPDDCKLGDTWIDGDTAQMIIEREGKDIVKTRTVMVQKELYIACFGSSVDTYEIFVIKSAVNFGKLNIDIVVCEKDDQFAQIERCSQIEPEVSI